MAVLEPGGARVVGLAAEVEAPAAVRPDRRGDTDRPAEQVQGPALLDMQLDEGADAGQPFGVGADRVRVLPGLLHRPGEADTVGVEQLPGVPRGQAARGQPGADAGQAEAGALLVHEVDDSQRPRRAGAAVAQLVEGGEGRDHAERPVEGAPVGDGVQVGAGDDGVARRGIAEPGPLVAVAVRLVGQAAVLGLRAEPLPAVRVGRRPGVAAVAAGPGVPADQGQLPPHRGEAGPRSGVGHEDSRIGIRTSRSAATSAARS